MTDTQMVKLSSNENCYGCSPLALDAILHKFKDVNFYPEANPITLKQRLAEELGVTANNIIVGAGSVRIIDGLIQTFVRPGEEVLTFEKSFIAYSQFSKFHHHICHLAPLTDFRCTPENLLPFITEKTRLIFIANPNNPTGTIISHSELEDFLGKISPDIIVVVDEAYAEYVTDLSFPDSLKIQKKHPNLVILRSFSKIYGLAGLRIGYGIMDKNLASEMYALQIPFSINYLSPMAAIAALGDPDFIRESAIANARQRAYLFVELKGLGFNVLPTQANFIYLWFDTDDEKKAVYDRLFENSIIICDLKIFGQSLALRITIGNREVCEAIIAILREYSWQKCLPIK